MSSDGTNIEIQEFAKMVEEEKEQWKRRSIYKLPARVTSLNKTAYTPQVVSLGPYHCENENLKPMEEHKERAIKHFLIRSGLIYDDIVRSLSVMQKKLMDAYDSLPPDFQHNPDAFLELMIRDGIFILEICGYGGKKSSDYAYNDPIFCKLGCHVIPHITRDMLMLENQIPMQVLYMLYGLQSETGKDGNKVVFQFFFPYTNASRTPTNSLHILDMYRIVLIGSHPTPVTNLIDKFIIRPHRTSKTNKLIKRGNEEMIIRSAVELDGAGIKIKKSKTNCLGDISFKKGVLRLPMIMVDDMIEPLSLNLMAYERFHYEAGYYVTNFIFFMNNIIDDAPDVRLLHSRDIIQNYIGTNEEVAKLFNSLSKDIYLDSSSPLEVIYESVNAYCETKISKCRAALYHPPWRRISVIAGAVFSTLTIVQTVFAILDYHKKG